MYKLFYAPGSAAMAPHAAIEEIGAKCELVQVDLQKKAHQRPEYLKLNPKGRVPVFVDGNFVLTSDGAIVEAQVTAEGECYDEEGLLRLLRLARIGCTELFQAQLKAVGR